MYKLSEAVKRLKFVCGCSDDDEKIAQKEIDQAREDLEKPEKVLEVQRWLASNVNSGTNDPHHLCLLALFLFVIPYRYRHIFHCCQLRRTFPCWTMTKQNWTKQDLRDNYVPKCTEVSTAGITFGTSLPWQRPLPPSSAWTSTNG